VSHALGVVLKDKQAIVKSGVTAWWSLHVNAKHIGDPRETLWLKLDNPLSSTKQLPSTTVWVYSTARHGKPQLDSTVGDRYISASAPQRRTPMMSPTDIPSFASSQLNLLAAEHTAELDETALLTSTHAPSILQRAGLALLNLHISAQRTGFGGKTLLELSLDPAVGGGDLPEHGLRVGDICAVAEQPKASEKKKDREGMEAKKVTGVITRVRREEVTVALDKEEVDVPNGGKLWLYVQLLQSLLRRCGWWGQGRLICRLNVVSSSQTRAHTSASLRS